MTDEGTFTPKKLRQMMREMDKLMITDDVIAVSMLFPPDKALGFSDHKGTVWAMGPALWHRVKAAAAPTPGEVNPILAHGSLPMGIPVVFEGDDDVWRNVRDRIIRSMEAACDTSELLERLRFEAKLLRPNDGGADA